MYNYNSYCVKMRGQLFCYKTPSMKFINIKHLALSMLLVTNASYANVDDYLSSLHQNHNKIYMFFKQMPKGGELHYHFTGSAYPEELIGIINKSNFYLDPKSYSITDKPATDSILSKVFFQKKENIKPTVQAWSMQNLVASYKNRHNHFFNVFPKVYPIYHTYYKFLLAKMLTRAASQHEMYMEIIFQSLDDADFFGSIIKKEPNLSAKQDILLKNSKFNNNVNLIISNAKRYLDETYAYLKCDKNPSSACQIKVKWQAFALRETEENAFFAQSLAAFLAASKSDNIVGVNIVQPENGKIALRDFKKHMQIFKYLHNQFPDVNISMHAGELDPKTNIPKNLTHHIYDSVFIAHAQRIGHGTDIRYEKNHEKLLNYMAKNNLPVEVNLTSNKLILSISGSDHPIKYYLQHEVPIVLSTDDEGILKTDLTSQYVDAYLNYNLNYNLNYHTIKQINRNTLTYSFLPGKSIWSNPQNATLVPECELLSSQTCKNFIATNEKAKMQWQLEQNLLEFEKKYSVADNKPIN